MEGVRRVMLALPTGAGKTRVAAEIVKGARAKGNRVLFVVPAVSLVDQTVTAFWQQGITEVGVIQADHPMTNWSKPVQVASVQTLQRRTIPDADVVVIDEAHSWFAMFGTWMSDPAWAKVPFIGLSATPWTKGLGKHYERLIVGATMRELIDAGFLSPFRVFAPSHPDLDGVRTLAGDFHEGDLSKAMDKPQLVADVVDTWKRLSDRRPTLCFAVDRAHAKSLQRKFQETGIAAGYIDAYTTSDERERIRRDFHRRSIDVVCNVGCLTTGIDWDVRCIILARPTKSEMLYVQIVGRGLRTAEGKDTCLILDHSDTTQRLGFVTDIHHEALDDGTPRGTAKPRERKAALPKECPSCSYLKPAKVAECPACGFKAEVQSDLEAEDGELVEVGKPKAAVDRETKQRWWSMLLHVARSRGHKEGWAAHKYREKFGVWPRNMNNIAREPDGECLRFVKHSMIRFAKGREKAQHGHVA